MIKKSFIKKSMILVITALFLLQGFNLFSQEESETKEKEIKFPGKFNLEYKSQMYSDIKGAQPEQSLDGDAGDIYWRNELKGKITLKPVKFYNIAFWLKDRIDWKIYDNGDDDSLGEKLRNRFYIGLDNIFILPMDIMNIGLNFELRIANDLNKKGDGIEVRVSPILDLSGKYKFGFSWGLYTLFEFYFQPALYKFPYDSADDQEEYYGEANFWGEDKYKNFQKFQVEIDKFYMDYEFFHFFLPKQLQCSIRYEMYMLATVYAHGYQNIYNYYKGDQKSLTSAKYKMNMMDLMKHYVGFNFNLWGIQPYIGFYCIISQTTGSWGDDDEDLDDHGDFNKNGVYTEFRPGLRTGVDFEKDWFSLGIEYTGVVLVSSTDPMKEWGGEIRPAHWNWENHISSYIKFKL